MSYDVEPNIFFIDKMAKALGFSDEQRKYMTKLSFGDKLDGAAIVKVEMILDTKQVDAMVSILTEEYMLCRREKKDVV